MADADFKPPGELVVKKAGGVDPLPLTRPKSVLGLLGFGIAYVLFLLPLTIVVAALGLPLAGGMSVALSVRAAYGFVAEMMIAIVEQRRPDWAGSGVIYALSIVPRTLTIVGPFFLPQTWLKGFDGGFDLDEKRPKLFYGWREFWTTLLVTAVFWAVTLPMFAVTFAWIASRL